MKKQNETDPIDSLDDDMMIPEAPENKYSMNKNKRLILGIAAAVLICAIAVVLPSVLEAVTPPAETQAPAASQPPQASAVPVGNSELIITVYAAEWEETALQPNAAIQLNEYSPAQSDVPGLPFIITASEGLGKDSIRIDVDAGNLITWAPPDYATKQRGSTYVLSSGDTIYWSPIDAQGSAIPGCHMTVTAYDGDNNAHAVSVVINQTSDFHYTAEIK